MTYRVAHETHHGRGKTTELHLYHNRPASDAVYTPVSQTPAAIG
jgi:hypothetical protein